MAAGDPGTRKRNYSATAIQTTLVNSITAAATGDTTTSVAVVSVSGFPSTVPYTLILDPDGSKEEVVTVTAATSTTLTITRGQDNTAALSHAAGTAVRHGVSAREFKELQTHIAARGYDADSAILSGVDTHVHGLAAGDGSVVGSDQSVTLTRKTLTTPTINGATLTGTVTSTASIVVSGAGTITGLSSAGMSTSSATPKSYVDAILGSATAASTSATSAATSATSAATSATSAAASATASASSASAAATSASSALTSQTAAATSATSAAASATAAATSATSAAASATASASSASAAATSASSAATSASSAATSATSAAASATTASASSATAATSASQAATSASAAATSATSASASATAAATSATSAATSASSALTSQTAAATSATSAATSASSALTSQTAAATSATSAATSASSAATTYTAYDARYLGSKASAPTVDNQGGALITGATYWNTGTNTMYVWSGSAWTAISTTGYAAPTLGSTAINSGATVTNITGLTLTTSTVAADPTTALGIASKQYVDLVTAGVNYHAPAVAASVSNLSATYNNGTSGVGATLTADTNRAFSTLDGQTVSVGQRILIKDQTTQLQNGIYTLTTVGSGSAPWVITRATDNDQTPEIANGDVINVTGGTTNSGKTFVNSSAASITIGTTAITFASYYTGLPSQTGSAGYYLTTDGTTPSWGTVTTGVSTSGGSTITASGSAVIPLVLKGATSQTADLLQIKNSANTSLVIFSTSGNQTIYGGSVVGTLGGANNTPNNGLTVVAPAKATTGSGSQGVITVSSDDATNQLQGTVALITSATTSNRRLQIQSVEQGVAYRNITLAEAGGNVGIGASAPAGKLHTVLNTGYTAGAGWSDYTAVFATGGVSTSGGIGIAYDDTNGSSLNTIAPGVAWKKTTINADSIVLNYAGTVNAMTITGAGRVQVAAGSVLDAPLTTTTTSGAYTFVLTDAGKMVEGSGSSAYSFTVPPSTSVAYATGAQINILQTGTGQITIAPGSGVTINGTPGLKLRAQWSSATLIKRATDTWVLIGDIVA